MNLEVIRMNKKSNLVLINFFFLFLLLRFGRMYGFGTILILVSIFTIANVFDFIFDKFNLLVTKILTFSISILVILNLISSILNNGVW